MFDLTGKRAIVCGSTQGIGKAAAVLLARQGASLTLVARDAEALHRTRTELSAVRGQAHHAVQADFRDPPALRENIARHVLETGPVDILVNNTGGPAAGPIFDAEPSEFLAAMTMHLVCNQLLVQTLVPGMKERGYGRIINVISTSVREPIPGLGVSNATRAAVASWAKTLSGELGPFGITVNNVLPGYTDTVRLRKLMESRAERTQRDLAEIERDLKEKIPLGRFAAPDEIAAAIVFLASPEAAYVNGVSLPVDGGRTSAL